MFQQVPIALANSPQHSCVTALKSVAAELVPPQPVKYFLGKKRFELKFEKIFYLHCKSLAVLPFMTSSLVFPLNLIPVTGEPSASLHSARLGQATFDVE